jgi:hypothetical protein
LGFLDCLSNPLAQPVDRLRGRSQKRLPFRLRQRNMNDALEAVRDVQLMIHDEVILAHKLLGACAADASLGRTVSNTRSTSDTERGIRVIFG